MKKLLAATAALALLTPAGCAGGGTTDTPSDTGTDGTGGTTTSDASGPLIVYTNSGSDGRDVWLTEQAKEAGFDVQLVQAGGGDTKNKLINEVGNPVADVVFGLNNFYFEQVVQAGALEAYTPSWSDEIDKATASPDGMYWPIVQQGIVLVYKDGIAQGAPADWTDLATKADWKGRYETPAALTGATTQMVLSGILVRYTDPSGELGISDEGWTMVEDYLANGRPAESGVDVFKAIADGSVDAGQMFTSGIPQREQEYGLTPKIAEPSVGVPFATEQVALVKGSARPETAKKFIDWFGSAEFQGTWSAEYSTMPANEGALSQTADSVKQLHEGLKVQDIDWAFVGENIDAWVEKMTLEVLG